MLKNGNFEFFDFLEPNFFKVNCSKLLNIAHIYYIIDNKSILVTFQYCFQKTTYYYPLDKTQNIQIVTQEKCSQQLITALFNICHDHAFLYHRQLWIKIFQIFWKSCSILLSRVHTVQLHTYWTSFCHCLFLSCEPLKDKLSSSTP